uniref:Uncharacterized protein n=1 Tax=Glossina pallidipes TaxID=7398 RepID=A0A1A9Z0T2_GLOPL
MVLRKYIVLVVSLLILNTLSHEVLMIIVTIFCLVNDSNKYLWLVPSVSYSTYDCRSASRSSDTPETFRHIYPFTYHRHHHHHHHCHHKLSSSLHCIWEQYRLYLGYKHM